MENNNVGGGLTGSQAPSLGLLEWPHGRECIYCNGQEYEVRESAGGWRVHCISSRCMGVSTEVNGLTVMGRMANGELQYYRKAGVSNMFYLNRSAGLTEGQIQTFLTDIMKRLGMEEINLLPGIRYKLNLLNFTQIKQVVTLLDLMFSTANKTILHLVPKNPTTKS